MAINLPVGEATPQEISSSVYFPESKMVLADDCRKLLEEYSGITPDRVIPHILQIVSQSELPGSNSKTT